MNSLCIAVLSIKKQHSLLDFPESIESRTFFSCIMENLFVCQKSLTWNLCQVLVIFDLWHLDYMYWWKSRLRDISFFYIFIKYCFIQIFGIKKRWKPHKMWCYTTNSVMSIVTLLMPFRWISYSTFQSLNSNMTLLLQTNISLVKSGAKTKL